MSLRYASFPRRFATATFGAIVIATAACAAGEGGSPLWPAGEVLVRLTRQDALVEAVGFRLATANSDLCPHGWNPGFSIHTIEQYGRAYRAAASRMFGLERRVGLMSVVPGSPAAAAGLRHGDALERIDGVDLPASQRPATAADFARTGAAQQLILQTFADGVARLSLTRAGVPVELEVRAVRACPSIFQVVPGRAMNGEADGVYVQVSSSLTALAQSDDELAALLAHELAHNILGHRRRLDRLGVDRGPFAALGRNARLIRETEAEADRLSIYLMARAGYMPERALDFWERVRRVTAGLFRDPTHPRWSERLQSMREERDRIAAAGSVTDARLPPDLAGRIPGQPPLPD